MAITIDATSTGVSSSATTIVVSHTNAGNLLISTIGTVLSGVTVSGVTYDGEALTLATTAVNGDAKTYVYYKYLPSIGTSNIVVTLNTEATVRANNASFFGSTGAKGNDNTKTGTAQNKSITLTPSDNNSLLISSISSGGGTHSPSGDGQVKIESGTNNAADYEILVEQKAVEQTQSWTSDQNQYYAMTVTEFLADNPITTTSTSSSTSTTTTSTSSSSSTTTSTSITTTSTTTTSTSITTTSTTTTSTSTSSSTSSSTSITTTSTSTSITTTSTTFPFEFMVEIM